MSRKQQYDAHINSSYWKTVRKLVIARDGGRCLVCNTDKNLQVHHRSYKNVGNEAENLGDLSTLCECCHGLFHSEKAKRRREKRRQKKKAPKNLPLMAMDDRLDMNPASLGRI